LANDHATKFFKDVISRRFHFRENILNKNRNGFFQLFLGTIAQQVCRHNLLHHFGNGVLVTTPKTATATATAMVVLLLGWFAQTFKDTTATTAATTTAATAAGTTTVHRHGCCCF
jgi:hypothetical protein